MPGYEAALEGFTVNNATRDHVLEVDGKRDEVYRYTDVRLVDQSGATLLRSEKRSAIMGDTDGFPNLVQAGSASNLGGLLTGDVFPTIQQWPLNDHDASSPIDARDIGVADTPGKEKEVQP
jgi:hypothetical protein